MKFQKEQLWKWLCATLFVIMVPNIIFWILGTKVFLIRGTIVLEYLLIAGLYPFIARRLFMVIWVLFAIFDLVFATCSLFFMDFFEIMHALTKIPHMPLASMLKWAGVLIVFVLIILAMVALMIRYNSSYPFLRFKFLWPFIVGMLLIDFSNGQGPLRRWSPRLYNTNNNIISVPSYTFILSIRKALFPRKMEVGNVEYLGSVAQKVFSKQPDSAAVKKEVLILVESWGLINNPELQHEILQPLYKLNASRQYAITEGQTHYKYLTQAGEFREITGYLFHFYQAQSNLVKQNSLLIKKQHQGFHVIGMHGFTGQFYKRKQIWSALGVQEAWFAEDFRKSSLSLCGNSFFYGICDTAITTWMFKNMNRQPERKEFYYWVTLNTHVPVVEIHDNAFKNFAEKWKKQGIAESVLQLAYQHQQFFSDLAVKLSDPHSPKAHVLLVGDHAPPFVDPVERKMYDPQLVPYVDLMPNQ